MGELNITKCFQLLEEVEKKKNELLETKKSKQIYGITCHLSVIWSDMGDMLSDIEEAYDKKVEEYIVLSNSSLKRAEYVINLQNEGLLRRKYKAKIKGIEKVLSNYRDLKNKK